MGFRKDKSAALEWQRWLTRCRETLILCGVPADAYESQRNWFYFLGHASMSTGTNRHWFSLDQLSREQRMRLNAFLEEEYGSQEHPPDLLLSVRRNLSKVD